MIDYRTLPAGAELDVLVAELVFWFRWDGGDDGI